jgi:hypothetical protein
VSVGHSRVRSRQALGGGARSVLVAGVGIHRPVHPDHPRPERQPDRPPVPPPVDRLDTGHRAGSEERV